MSLYKHDPPVYDKNMMLNVQALAGVGNDAAHNNPKLKQEDVKRLMDRLLIFWRDSASRMPSKAL